MMIIYHAVKPFIDGGMILFYVYSYLTRNIIQRPILNFISEHLI